MLTCMLCMLEFFCSESQGKSSCRASTAAGRLFWGVSAVVLCVHPAAGLGFRFSHMEPREALPDPRRYLSAAVRWCLKNISVIFAIRPLLSVSLFHIVCNYAFAMVKSDKESRRDGEILVANCNLLDQWGACCCMARFQIVTPGPCSFVLLIGSWSAKKKMQLRSTSALHVVLKKAARKVQCTISNDEFLQISIIII